ncbi:MAG: hypothetical protein JWO59_1011, partial [Chloroflexi bacterium]|nr:hypothetical protein [Chloroflexota bacterium]
MRGLGGRFAGPRGRRRGSAGRALGYNRQRTGDRYDRTGPLLSSGLRCGWSLQPRYFRLLRQLSLIERGSRDSLESGKRGRRRIHAP